LMLTQRSLKRLLVLSTVEDVGFLLLGVFSLKTLGYEGAMIAAATHALAKALLFVCLSGPEADGALSGEATGLATRYPVSAFGFLFGMLAMLGIPPTMGFIGRWRLYETALQINPLLLTVFILSSVMALIAYTLALTRVWWGPASGLEQPQASPPQPSAHPFRFCDRRRRRSGSGTRHARGGCGLLAQTLRSPATIGNRSTGSWKNLVSVGLLLARFFPPRAALRLSLGSLEGRMDRVFLEAPRILQTSRQVSSSIRSRVQGADLANGSPTAAPG